MRSLLAAVFANNAVAMVVVAQLVESRIVIPVVVGSSPIDHPKEFKEINGLQSFLGKPFFFSLAKKANFPISLNCIRNF